MRRRRLRQQQTTTPAAAATPEASRVEQAITLLASQPLIDRLLTRMLSRPRLLQIMVLVLGQLLIISMFVRAFLGDRPEPMVITAIEEPTPRQVAQGTPPPAQSESTTRDLLIALVAAYNEASIQAGRLNRLDLIAPYIDPTSEVWSLVTTEFARRAQSGESHEAQLMRWNILRVTLDQTSAAVETQEDWRDRTIINGAMTDTRSVVSQNVYHFRQSEHGAWLITKVETKLISQ